MSNRPRPWSLARVCIILACVAALAAVVAFAAAPAGATGPSYPGETLTLTQNDAAVAGMTTDFTASGQQPDVGSTVGGYDFHAFAKDKNVDPTCSPSFQGEEQASLDDPHENAISGAGQYTGSDTSFSVAFKVHIDGPGLVLICGYTEYIGDTVATAQLTVTVPDTTPPPTPTTTGTTPVPPPPPTTKRPVNVRKPSVALSAGKLVCHPGTWTGATGALKYGWLISGHRKTGATSSKLAVSRSMHHHSVQCRVTASNKAGATTATSASYRVR
jgi:hypothetical protein